MSGCDYCDENLPLYHKREADEYGLEPAQFIPCAQQHPSMRVVNLLSAMIEAGFSRDDVSFVNELAKGRTAQEGN